MIGETEIINHFLVAILVTVLIIDLIIEVGISGIIIDLTLNTIIQEEWIVTKGILSFSLEGSTEKEGNDLIFILQFNTLYTSFFNSSENNKKSFFFFFFFFFVGFKKIIISTIVFAQSAGAVEYTYCISAEG